MIDKLKRWVLGVENKGGGSFSYGDILSGFDDAPPQNKGDALSEPTYFTCLKLLSESVGKLSVHLLDGDNQKVTNHDAVAVLRDRANQFMNPTTLKQLLEYNRNHYGNSYAYLAYDNRGKLRGIYPLDPRCMQIYVDNLNMWNTGTGYFYQYSCGGQTQIFKPEQILHFKGGMTENGLVGRSVREILLRTIGTGASAETYLQKLYEEGLTSNAILKYTGDLDPAKKKRLVDEIAKLSRDSASARIIPIPLGFDLSPLNLTLADAQFAELKKYNSLQIAAAFGVKPNQLNDYEKSSYNNSEMQNLSFYVETLLFILQSYEEEFNAKLLSDLERAKGYKWKFNVSAILRGDLKSQAEALTQYVAGSVYTVNEAREKAGLPPIEKGDVIICNGSYVDIRHLGEAYTTGKGGEN